MEGLTYIKLIASDLDGTLLQNEAQELTPRAIELIRALTQKGVILLPQADASMQTNDFSFTRSKTISPTSPKTVLCAFIRGKLFPGTD